MEILCCFLELFDEAAYTFHQRDQIMNACYLTIHSYYTDSTIKLSQEIYSWSVKGANCITLSPHVSIVREHPTSSPIAFFDVALGTWEVPPRKPDGSRGSDMLCIDALNTCQIWSSVVARDMRNLGHGLLKLWSSSWSNAKFRVPLQPCREMRQDNIDIVQFASAVYYCSEDEGKATPWKNTGLLGIEYVPLVCGGIASTAIFWLVDSGLLRPIK